MEWFKNMFTEKDNITWCPVRVATALIGIIYHIMAGAGMLTGSITLDIASLGEYLQQMTLFIGAGGLTVGAKSLMKADA